MRHALKTLELHKIFSQKLQEETPWQKETADRKEILM